MMKKKKKLLGIIISVLLIAVILALCIWKILIPHTYTNSPDTSGNTSGNLHNKGLFCEYDGKVYYSNPYDQNALYVYNPDTNSSKKLAEGSVKYINTDGHYIYYVKEPANTTEKTEQSFAFLSGGLKGVYRCDMNGKNTKVLTSSVSSALHLIGNTLYFQHYDEDDNGPYLYAMSLDGKTEQKVANDALNPAGFSNGIIYATGFSNAINIRLIDTATNSISSIPDIKGYSCIPDGNYLYYMDLDRDYGLSRYNMTTKEIEHLTEDRLDMYTISGDYIFYQVSDEETPGLYRMHKDSLDSELIKEGVFCNLNCDSTYLYFNDFYNTVPIYRVPISGSNTVSEFTEAENIVQKK